jgi:hypothetical protein
MPSSPPSARLSLDRTVNDQRRLTKAAPRFDDNIEVQPSGSTLIAAIFGRANIYLSIKRSLWSFQFAALTYS